MDHKCYGKGETWQQRAILVALGLVYYFRLNSEFREEYKEKMEDICVDITFTDALDDEVCRLLSLLRARLLAYALTQLQELISLSNELDELLL